MNNNTITIEDSELHAKFEAKIVRDKQSGGFVMLEAPNGNKPQRLRAQSWSQAQAERGGIFISSAQ
jgi:ferredoxin-NADP reductase